ncbi:ROK family protein [Marinilactibacillus psychrotolerans]|uniref:ROK family protein n=1 Tax=Marinilactibacillus psychrotolerans TaxID=191770 RepID=UPI003886CD47
MRNYLCIDIGGTSIKYGVYDEKGKNISKISSVPTNVTKTDNLIMHQLKLIIDLYIKHFDLSGICISSAGVIDYISGKVVFSGYTIPRYSGLEIKKTIENEYSIPCEVENDVNSAALGEYWKGAGRGGDSIVCLTVGTGVGGAILINGQLMRGYSNTAGEVGYMIVDGKRFQDVASTASLVERVKKRKSFSINSQLTGKTIIESAINGDNICLEEIDTMIDALSTGIINLMYVINPEVIILGGGIMEQKEFFENKINTCINNKIIDSFFNKTEIRFAEKGNEAGMLGALYNFVERRQVEK